MLFLLQNIEMKLILKILLQCYIILYVQYFDLNIIYCKVYYLLSQM